MKRIKFQIKGVAPLLLHNGELANPMNPFAKELKRISGKRKKTDEDFNEMSFNEWYGALYLNEKKNIIIPTIVIEGSVFNGAAKDRLKSQFKPVFMVEDPDPVLIYDGPKDIDELYKSEKYIDMRMVGVNGSRILRTRPRFKTWELEFTCIFDETIIEKSQVIQAIEKAGRLCGIGDYTPKFGRFEIINTKEL